MTVAVANTSASCRSSDWQRWEQVGLKPTLELDELVLNWTDHRVKDLDARGALVSLALERTIEGGSTVTMTLRDPDRQLFRQRARRTRPIKQRGRKARVQARPRARSRRGLGADARARPHRARDGGRARRRRLPAREGAPHRELGRDRAHLRGSHRLLAQAQAGRASREPQARHARRVRALAAARGQVGRYRFVCPELHSDSRSTRPTQEQRARSPSRDARSTRRARARARAATTEQRRLRAARGITVKGVEGDARSARNMHGVLTECSAQGCSRDVMVATVCCVTQESVAKRLGYGDAAGPDSRGLFQQRAPWGRRARVSTRASDAHVPHRGRGRAARLEAESTARSSACPGSIESAPSRPCRSASAATGSTSAKRDAPSKAWGGQAHARGRRSGGGSYTKSYQFTRNADESSWDAIKRLADEVGWRCFVVGNSVYYMSEADLYARRARYEVTPDDPSVLELSTTSIGAGPSLSSRSRSCSTAGARLPAASSSSTATARPMGAGSSRA
jgi:hypothetical protein